MIITTIKENDITDMYNQGMVKEKIIEIVWNQLKHLKYRVKKEEARKMVDTVILKEYNKKYSR